MKRIPIVIFFALAALLPLFTVAQKQANVWYFGNYAGVNFNSGAPVVDNWGLVGIPNGQYHDEGSSVICDNTGKLLFYSNGTTVWNDNYQYMPNGTGLMGNFSTTQSSLIIPAPANPDRFYYLFTLGSAWCCNVGYGLRSDFGYSVIDICRDGGKGDVVVYNKNTLLATGMAEKLAGAIHANNHDYWILTHRYQSDQFLAFLLTNSGIADTVISSVGINHTGPVAGSMGQMKISPNGRRVAIAASSHMGILQLCDFDPATGIVSNCNSLQKPYNDLCDAYGVEFSADNSKLYITGAMNQSPNWSFIAQYDLNAGGGNLTAVNASRYMLDTIPIGFADYKGLQIGPDGKIYMVSYTKDSTLAVIQFPDSAGSACGFVDRQVYLGGRLGSYNLPSVVAGYRYNNTSPDPKCLTTDLTQIQTDETDLVFNVQNPATDNLNVTIYHPAPDLSFVIVSIDGRRVKELSPLPEREFSIPVDELAKGFYTVALLQNGRFVAAKKIVMAH